VAAWVTELQEKHGAPGVKQHLAAVRMLFERPVTGQVVPMNPAAAVRGPKHVVKTGKTPVLDAKEWRKLIDSIPTETAR
jgi:site-specific recombinase XerC